MADSSVDDGWARVCCNELAEFLAHHAVQTQRDASLQKLESLTSIQFEELSMDVCDVVRQKKADGSSEIPGSSLQSPSYFPQKRVIARERLYSLPLTRVKDLASDVLIELHRRFPSLVKFEVPFKFREPPSPTITVISSDKSRPHLGSSCSIGTMCKDEGVSRSDTLATLTQRSQRIEHGHSNMIMQQISPAISSYNRLFEDPALMGAVVMATAATIKEMIPGAVSSDFMSLNERVMERVTGDLTAYISNSLRDPEIPSQPNKAPQESGRVLEKQAELSLPEIRQPTESMLEMMQKFLGEMTEYLVDHPTETGSGCWIARKNLALCSEVYFRELLIDVLDEHSRRKKRSVIPTEDPLPRRPDFNERRNTARYKFSALSDHYFKNLCSDILYEICRRYPSFAERDVDSDKATDEDAISLSPSLEMLSDVRVAGSSQEGSRTKSQGDYAGLSELATFEYNSEFRPLRSLQTVREEDVLLLEPVSDQTSRPSSFSSAESTGSWTVVDRGTDLTVS